MYLKNFHSIQPPYQQNQAESLTWLASIYKAAQQDQSNTEAEYNKLLQRVACSAAQIATRHFFIPDPELVDIDQHLVYPVKDSPRGITMLERQQFYHKAVKKIFDEIYELRKFPDDIIHVSCTGYISPSAAQMAALRAPHNVTVTHSYHMGCYGAFPALRMASGFLSNKDILGQKKSVDLVHTELCSLHMDPQDPSLEQMVIQSLFADGAIAYSMTSEKPTQGYKLKSLYEELVPGTEDAMEWMVSDWGMKMTLSKDVPTMVGQKIFDFTQRWLESRNESFEELLEKAIFAVHPGGPKIIDQVAKQLSLRDDQVSGSRALLKDRGNMSSATLPHLWERILLDDTVLSGTPILSFAFGPGLTICGSLMEKL
jgi:predicted naringenin-chalcone synthase